MLLEIIFKKKIFFIIFQFQIIFKIDGNFIFEIYRFAFCLMKKLWKLLWEEEND